MLKLGQFSEQEKLLFQKQMELFKQSSWKLSELWGLFSIPFKHRNGRQCRDYYISSNLQNYKLEDENISNNIHFKPINKASLSSCFDYYKDKIEYILSHHDDNEKENDINNNNNMNNNSNESESGDENEIIPLRIKKKKERKASLPSSSSPSSSPKQIKIKPLYLSSSESSDSSPYSTPINSLNNSPINSPLYSPIPSPINSPQSSSSIIPENINSENTNNNNNNSTSYYTKVIINNNEDNYNSYNSIDNSESSDDNEQPLTELLQPLSPSHYNNKEQQQLRRSRSRHRHRNRNINSIKIIENFGVNNIHKHHHHHHNQQQQHRNKSNNNDKDDIDKGSLSPSSVNSESIIPHLTIIHNYKNSMKNRRNKKKQQQNNTQTKNIRQFTGLRGNSNIVNSDNNGNNPVIDRYIDVNNNDNDNDSEINNSTPSQKPRKPVESEYSGRSLKNETINELKPQKIIQFSFPNSINPINYPISILNQSFAFIDDYCFYFDDMWSENDLESILSITFMKSLNCIMNNENINEENQNCVNILLSIDQYINYNVNLNNNLSVFYEGLSNCIRSIIYKLSTKIQQMNIVPSQVESILNIYFIYLYKWYSYCQNSEELFYIIVSCHLYLLVINIKISISAFSTFFIPFQIIQSFNTRDYNSIIDRISSSNICLFNNLTYKYNIFLIFIYSLLYKYDDQSRQYVKQNSIEEDGNANIIDTIETYFNSLFKELVNKYSNQLPYIEELFKTTFDIIKYLNYSSSDYISLWQSIHEKYDESCIYIYYYYYYC